MSAPFVKLPNGEMIRSDLIISVRVENERVVTVNGEKISREKCMLVVDFGPFIDLPKSTYMDFETIEERDGARNMLELAMIEADLIVLGRGAS